jgi:hypothetical protein
MITIRKFLTKLLKNIVQQYWIEITTAKPSCVYYFGPFLTYKGAKLAEPGFIEDLETEKAQDIKAEIKRCQPQELTIFEQLNDNSDVAFT